MIFQILAKGLTILVLTLNSCKVKAAGIPIKAIKKSDSRKADGAKMWLTVRRKYPRSFRKNSRSSLLYLHISGIRFPGRNEASCRIKSRIGAGNQTLAYSQQDLGNKNA